MADSIVTYERQSRRIGAAGQVVAPLQPRWRPETDDVSAERAGFKVPGAAAPVVYQRQSHRAAGQDTGTLGLGEQIRTGLASGLHAHPFLGPVFDHIAVAAGYPRSLFTDLERAATNETSVQKLSRLAGEYGPDLMIGFGVYGLGSRLAVSGLRAAVGSTPRVAAGWLGTQANLIRARALQDTTQRLLATTIAQAGGANSVAGAQILASAASNVLKASAPGALERIAMSIGGSTALGAYTTAGEYGKGYDIRTAAQTGALTAAVTGGFDLGIAGLAKAFSGRARALLQDELKKTDPGAIQALRDEMQDLIYVKGPGASGLDKLPLVDLHAMNGRLARHKQWVNALPANDPNKPHLLKYIADTEGQLSMHIGRRRTDIESLRQITTEPSEKLLTTDRPYYPRGPRSWLAQSSVYWASTPESFFDKMGEIGARVFGQLELGEIKTMVQSTVAKRSIQELRANTFKALGYGPNSRDPLHSGLLLRLTHEFERKGGTKAGMAQFLAQPEWVSPAGVKVKLGITDPAKVDMIWDSLDELTRLHEQVASLVHSRGGLPLMRQDEMDNFGVRVHLPHLAEAGHTDQTFYHNLEQVLGPQEASRVWGLTKQANALPSQQTGTVFRPGPVRDIATRVGNFGVYDYQRLVKGTMWEKFTGTVPGYQGGQRVVGTRGALAINPDPFDAAFLSMQAGYRRYHVAGTFGYKGQLIDTYALAVGAEAEQRAATAGYGQIGSLEVPAAAGQRTATFFKNLVDDLVDHRYYDEHLVNLARTVTSLNTASKMTLGVVLNMLQWQNTAYFAGFKNLAKGTWELLTNKNMRTWLESALAIPQGQIRGMQGPFDTGVVSHGMERLAEWLLKFSGFTPTEAMERYLAGAAGHAAFVDVLTRAGEGRLRGVGLDKAFRMMADVKVDLGREVARYRNMGAAAYFGSPDTKALLETVMFRTAQKTQFIPTKARKPLLWHHPVGRVLTQFKTFSLGQARLLKDTVFAEAAHGNLAPLASFMAMTPLSAEYAISTKDLFRDEPRTTRQTNPVMRAMELTFAVGGFGLAGDLLQAVQRREFANVLGGPTVDTLNRIGYGTFRALFDQDFNAITDTVTSLPVARATYRLHQATLKGYGVTRDMVNEYLDGTSGKSERIIAPVTTGAVQYKPRSKRVSVIPGPRAAMDSFKANKGNQ